MSKDETSNKPAHEIRVGRVRATVWANHSDRTGDWYSVTLSRLYKDAGGQWRDAPGFSRDDLPLVVRVAELADAWIREHDTAAAVPAELAP